MSFCLLCGVWFLWVFWLSDWCYVEFFYGFLVILGVIFYLVGINIWIVWDFCFCGVCLYVIFVR